MIELYKDYLFFQQNNGAVPCKARDLIIQLVGNSKVDTIIIDDVAHAIAYYFREELGRLIVTIDEFSDLLVEMLTALGMIVTKAKHRRKRYSRLWRIPVFKKKGAAAQGGRFCFFLSLC